MVQLYPVHDGIAGAALRELRRFQRILVARGQEKSVTFTLRDRDLSIVDQEGKRRSVQAPIEAWIGGGQPVADHKDSSAGVRTHFAVTSEKTLPE